MEPKTARTVKWTSTIVLALVLLLGLYFVGWGGLLSFIHVVICAVMVGAILLQSSKGGGLAALGGMGDQSPFGARSSAALRNLTYFLAGLFLLATLLLVKLPSRRTAGPAAPVAPLAPAPVSRPTAPPDKAAKQPAAKTPATPKAQPAGQPASKPKPKPAS